MTGPIAVSHNDLNDRRKQRRNQRNNKLWLFLWRLTFLSSLTLGLSGFIALPYWMIQNSSEIEIQGNQKLAKDLIRSWLEIPYPQQIWRLSIPKLSKHLQEIPALESATFNRQILQPKLTVEVKEREPVALAPTPQGEGFLDATGIWINRNFYQKSDTTAQKLSLTVLGYEEKYRSEWSKMYPEITNSALKIQSVDWRNPSNLILKTELGLVYFGPYNRDFVQKLLVLNKMKILPSSVPSSQISYIDLTDPQKPSLQVIPQSIPKK